MLGGLQIRSLHQELVGGGRMTDREFHDTILQGGSMPIEMVRAAAAGRGAGAGFSGVVEVLWGPDVRN